MSTGQYDPFIGKQLGAYLIQSRLGEGGMARVYKAYHARLRRDVAIKVIAAHTGDHAEFQARFEREAQLIASLEHSNIVAVYDFGEIDNLTYLVMQYVGGGTLRDQLHHEQPLDPRRAAHYTLQMARALHHAHQRGIVHRDIKPQNMLVSASDPNHLLLSDFGIAKLFDASQENTWTNFSSAALPANPQLTSADQIVGTADYMAPEQINKGPVDARTDVYALGVVLYQMLTGHVPFQSTTLIGLLYQHVNTPPRPIHEVNPFVPAALAQITAKALAKAPADRFQSAEEMAQALETVITPSTNPPAMPTIDQYATYGRLPGEYSQGRSTPLPSPYGSTSSSYAPNTSLINVPVEHQQTSISGTRGGISVTPPQKRPARSPWLQTGATLAIVAILVITFLTIRNSPFFSSSSPPTTQAAQPFTEHFDSNTRHWTTGTFNGLNGAIDNNQYTLTTGSANAPYFPYPADGGTLPANFTLTTQMMQSAGGTNIAYGLSFYLTFTGNQVKSCYAFIITNAGNYGVLRYDDGQLNTDLFNRWSGTSSAIHTGLHQNNTLQVVVKEHRFSFSINGQPLQIQGASAITDTAYAQGNLGLYVAGPNTSFVATNVQLAIP
ncbi:MAG TPA: serine/threonine-protein kinase [Ktedonobacteraceae bacterium]|nr:serine/threonine-protein kinase [Ktedonobacteraceae bacterium]